MDFLIRDFTPADQLCVARLIQEGMRQRWGSRFDPTANPDTADLWANYVEAGGEVLVGESEDTVVATATLIDWAVGSGRVMRMSVARSDQGRGLGRQLVAELVGRARRRGMDVLHVSTDTPWLDAVDFYTSCGFVAVGESEGDTHLELALPETPTMGSSIGQTAVMDHLTTEQLEAGLDHIRRSPMDNGRLELIVQRPAEDERVVLEAGELNAEEGLAGDTWNVRGSRRTDDGSSHPDMQLNLMNARVLALVAQLPERMPLSGDQLIVDLDLTAANLPAWTKLSMGDAVIEITDQPHTGCAKFTRRFGLDAHRFISSEVGKELKLRGVNARVVTPGTIRLGDVIRKL